MSRNKNTRNNNPANNRTAVEMQVRETYLWKWRNFIEKLILNRIQWTGLPPTVDERFLERCLARYGKAVFYNNGLENKGEEIFMATRVVTEGPPDVYDNYNKFRSIGPGWDVDIPQGKGVLIWNSTTRRDDWLMFEQYASDLAAIDLVARVNRKQQRWGVLLTGQEGSFTDTNNVVKALDTGEIVTSVLKDIADSIGVVKLDLTVPYLQKDFHSDRDSLLSELYTYLGIINVPREKSSYMNYDETSMENDAIARIREDLLFPRRQAAEAINNQWGLDISVEWRQDALEEIMTANNTDPSGGVEND